MNEFVKNTWAFWGIMIFAVGITLLIVIPVSADQPPEIDQGISEFRSDGVEIIHYQDGSKLYRATMEDGISSSDSLK